jgi:hypothetical protein
MAKRRETRSRKITRTIAIKTRMITSLIIIMIE